MKQQKTNGHSISSLFSLLLFGIFALFLMLMLLFSARVYQNTMEQTDSDTDFAPTVYATPPDKSIQNAGVPRSLIISDILVIISHPITR